MFGLLAKIFQQPGQNFLPRVQRNFTGKDVWDRNLSPYHFWSLSGNYFDFVKILFFKVRGIFPKTICFFVFEVCYQLFWTLNKKLRTFRTKTSPVSQISIIHLKPFSWRKNNLRNYKNVCFWYFKQKGVRDLGRNVLKISLYNDIEKTSAGLFQQNYKSFLWKLSDFETKVSVFWHEIFSSRSELH